MFFLCTCCFYRGPARAKLRPCSGAALFPNPAPLSKTGKSRQEKSSLRPVAAITKRFATVAGVLSGSLLWWLGVIAVVSGLSHALDRRVRLWIDRIAGVVLAVLGVDQIRRA